MLVAESGGGGGGATGGYEVVAQLSTFQVNADNTTTPIEQITARSVTYDVTYTFNVLRSTFLADGAANLALQKTQEVDALCGHAQVQAARGGQDQDGAGKLYNYLILTVGTPDFLRTTEIQIRMDQLGSPSAFAAVDAAWQSILALGPIVAPAV